MTAPTTAPATAPTTAPTTGPTTGRSWPFPVEPPHSTVHRAWRLPVGFGLLAMLVSLLGSWIPSLWEDETASLVSASRPLDSLFMMLGHIDAVHGTYYLGLHFWVDLFGSSPFSIRFPSAIAIGLCIAAVVILVRQLSSSRTAFIAGLVCALLPRLTYAGVEARSYAFSAAIAAWLTVLFVELLRRSRPKRMLWAAYAALLTLGIYCFLYVGLVVAAHAVLALWHRPGRRFAASWLVATAAGLAAAVPMVVWAFLERSQIEYLAPQTQVTPNSILVELWFGYSAAAIVAWVLIALAVGGAIGGAVTEAATEEAASGLGGTRECPDAARPLPSLELVAACWLFIPAALLIALGSFVPAFTPRYLTFCAPAAAVLIACGISRLAAYRWVPHRRHTRAAVIATMVVLAAFVPAYLVQRGPYAMNDSDWAQISATVGAHAVPGDGVLFDQSAPQSQRPELALRSYPAGFTGVNNVLLATPYTRNTSWADTMDSVPQAVARGRFAGVSRVWVVEYATPTRTDTWGLADLHALGFTKAAHYRTFRSEIIELTR
ncbi:glycosyltransferase family 39 protein [Rathayibacter soli]|uniref:glycosyltransferase family 39 protein n=1 Tax=Rathayibacter soli TaxID=3144168 RepID=UPI0027E40F76|nr:glycosyltransferase family 39 protein [Glaciibacter superstes]